MPPAPLHTPRTATHTGRNSTMQPQCTRRAAACQPRAARRAEVCASSLALLWMWTHVICQPAEYARARAWSRRVANMGSRNRPAPCACRTTGAQSPKITAVRGRVAACTRASQMSMHASHSACRLPVSAGRRRASCSGASLPVCQRTAAAPAAAPSSRPTVAPSYQARTPTLRCSTPWMKSLLAAVRRAAAPWARTVSSCAVHAPHAEHRACCQRDPAEAVVTPTGGGRGL